MRHFILLSLAFSTLAVFAAAGKKLEELSPAARAFLKKRQEFMASIDAEVYAAMKKIPGGKERFEYVKKHNEIYYKNLKLPKNAQIPLPREPADPGRRATEAYISLYARQSKRISDFNGSNPTAFNELFDNGYIRN